MNRRSVVVLLSVALGACVCAILVGFALFGGGRRFGTAAGAPPERGTPSAAGRSAKWTATPAYSRYVAHLRTLPVAALVKEIRTVAVLWQAVAATEEALARGGISTSDLETVYVQAHVPAARFVAIPRETLRLARDARRPSGSGGLTVAQFAQMLADFGWPFGTGATPGEQMMQILRELVTDARKDPNNPERDLGVYLDESAQLGQPPVDLTSAKADLTQVHLSLLDMQLFAAAFDRSADVSSPERATPAPGVSSSNPFSVTLVYAAEQPPHPCGQLRDKWLGQWGGDALGVGVREGRRYLIKTSLPAGAAAEFSKALGAINIALRIQKLVAIYADSEVAVTASNTSVHKPNETTPDKYVLFTARAGVSDKDWKEYEDTMGDRNLREKWILDDCLKTLGLPTYPDLSTLAADAQNWQVQWEIRPADSPHVEVKLGGTHPADDENVFDLPGMRQNKLVRKSPASAETELRLTIKPEKKADHDSGIETAATVKVCALVKTGGRPPASTFVTGARLGMGLAQSLVDLGAGWIQTMAPPSSCAALEVTYHVAAEMDVNFRSKIGVTYLAGPMKGRGTLAAQFKIRLVVDPATRNLTGTGQLTYDVADYRQVWVPAPGVKCAIGTTGTTHGSPVTVKATRFNVPHGPGTTPDIELEINLGQPTEDYVTRCTPAFLNPKKEPDLHWWITGFTGSHMSEFRGRAFVLTFDKATMVDATPTFAGIIKKEWKRTINPAVGSAPGVQTIIYDEDTIVTVVMVPKK